MLHHTALTSVRCGSVLSGVGSMTRKSTTPDSPEYARSHVITELEEKHVLPQPEQGLPSYLVLEHIVNGRDIDWSCPGINGVLTSARLSQCQASGLSNRQAIRILIFSPVQVQLLRRPRQPRPRHFCYLRLASLKRLVTHDVPILPPSRRFR